MSSKIVKILFKDSFVNRLTRQIDFIAKDSPVRAKRFKNQLIKEIKKIPKMPYANRQSIYFDNHDIRDLVFKGYAIVYRVNVENNIIEVFGLTKYQDKPTD